MNDRERNLVQGGALGQGEWGLGSGGVLSAAYIFWSMPERKPGCSSSNQWRRLPPTLLPAAAAIGVPRCGGGVGACEGSAWDLWAYSCRIDASEYL
jgi:hypothetical protein